uniref:Uncharacterized protein n=1 Tax=Glossina brevipalpis TaxID=37001 RepID=A0A1A9WKF5_9MUSC
MPSFCKAAKREIPNFTGIHFTHTDVHMASKCLNEVDVLLGITSLLASGLLLGFQSFESSVLNIYPDLFRDIYEAMSNNEMERAQSKQVDLNEIVNRKLTKADAFVQVFAQKTWFSELNGQKLRIYVGPARIYSGVNMVLFCNQAEDHITNFYGLYYNSPDLDMAQKCKASQRIMIIGMNEYMGSCLMLGFESFMTSVINTEPELIRDLYMAFKTKNLPLVRRIQNNLNLLVATRIPTDDLDLQIVDIKNWFNERILNECQFSAGPSRDICLREMK